MHLRFDLLITVAGPHRGSCYPEDVYDESLTRLETLTASKISGTSKVQNWCKPQNMSTRYMYYCKYKKYVNAICQIDGLFYSDRYS